MRALVCLVALLACGCPSEPPKHPPPDPLHRADLALAIQFEKAHVGQPPCLLAQSVAAATLPVSTAADLAAVVKALLVTHPEAAEADATALILRRYEAEVIALEHAAHPAASEAVLRGVLTGGDAPLSSYELLVPFLTRSPLTVTAVASVDPPMRAAILGWPQLFRTTAGRAQITSAVAVEVTRLRMQEIASGARPTIFDEERVRPADPHAELAPWCDGWGQRLVIDRPTGLAIDKAPPKLRSAGVDRQLGTADDLTASTASPRP